MKISTYIIKVQHDKGVLVIKTAARSKKAAIQMVMASEGCPLSAIV